MSGDFDLLAQQFDLDGEFETVLAQDYLPDGRSEIYIKNAEVSGFKDFDELISFFPFHVDKKVLETFAQTSDHLSTPISNSTKNWNWC